MFATKQETERYEILVGEREDGIGYAHVVRGDRTEFPTLAFLQGEHEGWAKGFWIGVLAGAVSLAMPALLLRWVIR